MMPCMSRSVLVMYCVQMATYITSNVQTSLSCVRTMMYPLGFSFLICPAASGNPDPIIGYYWLLLGPNNSQ